MAYTDDFIVKNGLVVRATNLANYNSTSTQTGAITTPGGLGIGGNAYIGGQLNVLTSATLAELQVNDVAKILSSAINTATISAAGNALQVTGGIFAAAINISGTAFVKGSQVLTQADGFKGGVISQPLIINTTTNSTSTQTGALVTPGGVGIGQDLWVGGIVTATGAMYSLGYQVPTLLTVTAGTGLAGGGTLSATNAVITLSNAGVLSLQASTGININTSTGNITITNIGVQQVTAGTDIQLSTSTGSVLISDISTLQSVTARGSISNQIITLTTTTANAGVVYSTNSNALNVLGGASFGSINVLNTSYQGGAQLVTTSTINQFIGGTIRNPLDIENTTDAVNTQTGALIVAGGVGIGRDLFVGKTLNVNGNATIYGSLNVLGTYTTVTVNSTQTYIESPLIDIGTGPNDSVLSINDTLDRGIVIHYNTGSSTLFDNHAFIGRRSSSGELVFLTDIQPGGTTEVLTNPLAGGNYGNVRFGVLNLVGGNPSTGYGTGDLIVTGGGSFNGSLYSTAIYDYGHRVLNSTSITTGTGISASITTTATGVIVTLTNIGVTSLIPGSGIYVNGGVNSATGVVTISNAGVISLSTSSTNNDLLITGQLTGNLVIQNQATLQTVTSRGNTSSYQVILNNSGASITNSATNALYLAGQGGTGPGGIYAYSIMLASKSTINGSEILTTGTINNSLGGIIPNAIHITSSTVSVSTQTGSLIVDAGVGFGSNLNVQGPLVVNQNFSAGGTSSVGGNSTVGGNLYTTGTLFVGTITSPNANLYLSTSTGGSTGAIYANNVNLTYYLANVYYVQSNGSDSNDGLRESTAFATIAHALSVVQSGGTIIVGAGTFTENFPLTVPQGVTIRGSGIRSTVIQPTSGTNTNDGFLLNGETTISDFVVSGYYSPGYGVKFANGCKITTKSPYLERISFITKGSTTTSTDPYGYNAGNAGNGAYLDASILNANSLEPTMLFNEVTFIVPAATGMYMTNGVRAEIVNTFFYFAAKAINAQAGSAGVASLGRTRLKLSNVSGTFTAGDTIHYVDPLGSPIATGTIASNDGTYVYISGAVWGFAPAVSGTAKVVTPYGNVQTVTSLEKFGTASAAFSATTNDYLQILSDTSMQFGNGAYTIESFIYVTSVGGTQVIWNKGNPNSPSTSFGVRINSSGVLVAEHGTSILTGSTVLSTSAWHHVALVRNPSNNTVTLFLDGNVEASVSSVVASVNNTDPFDIGADSTNGQWYYTGNIDEFRVSNVVRYTTSFSIPSAAFGYDIDTVFLMHMDGANAGTNFPTDATQVQNIYSTGNSPASAKQVQLADYHQFGAELRSIGSAAVFGNQGVIANGTGTDLKLIAFNMSFIGAGGDITDDASLTVQANEVIQTNGGKVFYQTVDQNGDFRVGNSFYVSQATGAVSFGNANLNLTSLASLQISNGTNATTILPGSVSAGEMFISGNTLGSSAGNININPAGTYTIVQSNLQVNGGFSVQTLTIPGSADSTSTTTGALQVTGGVGIGGDVYIAGTLSNVNAIAGNAVSVPNGGIGAQTLYIATQGFINNAKIVTTATIGNVLGGNVPNALYITTTTDSVSTNTGAFTVAGGVGIAKNVYVGGLVEQNNGMNVLSSLTLALVGLAGSVSYSGVTATLSLNNIGVTQIIAGTDISVSQNTGTVTINDTATLQSVTDRGFTTTNAINVTNASFSTSTIAGNAISVTNGGIGAKYLYLDTAGYIQGSQILTTGNASSSFPGQINTPLYIANSTNAINTQTGALTVLGGVGIGKDVYIGGSTYISGDLYVDGSNTVVNTTSLQTGDKTITLSTGSANAAVAGGSGLQIGYSTSTLWASFLFDGVGNWNSTAGINPTLDIQQSLGTPTARWNMTAGTVTFTTATTTSTQWNTTTVSSNALSLPNGGIGVAHLYVTSDAWVGTGKVITSSNLSQYTQVFNGGTINQPLIETDQTQSASTQTGALQVAGGVGIGKNLYVGGNNITLGSSYTTGSVYASAVYDSNNRVITNINLSAGTGISFGSASLAGPNPTLTVTNIGVTGVSVGAGLSVSTSTGNVLFVNTGVTSITAGTDTAITSHYGDIVLWNTSTLDSIAQRNGTTTATIVINNAAFTTTSIAGNALQVSGGIGASYLYLQTAGYINGSQIITTSTLNSFSGGAINNALQITNATEATSTTTGALQVTGGVGVGKSLWVGKDLHVLGDLFVDGTNTLVNSTSIQTGDKTITLSSASTLAGTATGSGIKVGASTTTFATLLFDGNSSWQSGASIVPASSLSYNLGSASLIWSNVYSANATITASTAASSTQSGVLQVAGGVGIGKQVYVGESINVNSVYASTTTQSGNSLGLAGGAFVGGTLAVGGIAWVQGAQVVTTNNPFDTVFTSVTQSFNTQSGALQVAGGVGIGGNLNITGQVNIANLTESTTTPSSNALVVSGGINADMININTIGTINGGIIITTSTIGNFAFNGGVINKPINITTTTVASSSITGALTVTGGVGIGGATYAYGTFTSQTTASFNRIQMVTATITGIFSSTSALVNTSTIAGNAIQVGGGIGTNYLNIKTAGWLNGSPILTAQTLNNYSGGTINNQLIINTGTQSVSTTTGALIVQNGGLGVGGNIWSGGSHNFIDPTFTSQGFFGPKSDLTAVQVGAYSNQPVDVLVNNNSVARFNTGVAGFGNTNPVFGIDLVTPNGQAGSANTISNLLSLVSTNWAVNFTADTPTFEITQTSYDGGNTFENWLSVGEQAAGIAQALVFAGGNYYNNSGLPTVTEWGRFTPTGNLILKNQIQANTEILNSSNNSTSTIAGNALQVTGGIGASHLYISQDGWIAGGKIITTANASSIAFNGGTITTPLYINTTTQSSSNITGALRVQGGAGINLNLNVGGVATMNGGLVSVNNTFTNINTSLLNSLNIGGNTTISTSTAAAGVTAGTAGLVVTGGVGINKNIIVNDTATILSSVASTTTIAGNALTLPNGGIGAVSLYLSQVGYINGAQIVTSSTINAFSGGSIANALNLSNLTNAVNTLTGALTVAGGVGIGEDTWIGGNLHLLGDLYVDGTQTIVNTTNIQTGDKVIYLSTGSSNATLASSAGISVGAPGNVFASLAFDGISSWQSLGNLVPTTSGGFNLGSPTLPWSTAYVQFSRMSGGTQSTTATNGTLVVTGGVGVSGNLNIGTSATVASQLFNLVQANVTQNAFYVAGGVGTQYLNVAQTAYVAGSPVITAANIAGYQFSGGTITGILTSTNTTSAFSTQSGAIQIQGGIATGNNLWVGNAAMILGTTSSAVSTTSNALQVVGGIGAYSIYLANNGYINGSQIVTAATINNFSGGTINSSLTINSSTQAVSTVTGAFQVINGGVGIGGNIWAGGYINVGGTANQPVTLGTTATGSLQVLGGASITGGLQVGTNAASSYFGGNVGINTTNPQQALEVNGNIVSGAYNSSRVQITSGGGSNAIYEVQGSESGYRWQIGSNLVTIGVSGMGFMNQNQTLSGGGAAIGAVSGLSGNLGLYTSNGSALTLRSLIDTSGNMILGIAGPTTPLAKLDVRGSFRAQSGNAEHVFLSNNSSQYVAIDITRTNTGNTADFRIGINGSAGNFSPSAGQGDVNLAFSSNLYYSVQNTYEVGKWTPTGLVVTTSTIATSPSTGALQVQGGVGVTGNLYVGSASSFTGAVYIASSVATTSSKSPNALVVSGGIGASSLWLDNPGWINGYQIVTTANIGSFTGAFNGGTVTNPIYIANSANATSTSTGALYTLGGIASSKDLWVGGVSTHVGATILQSSLTVSGVATFLSTASSTVSTTSNALQVLGGLGVNSTIYSVGDHFIGNMRVGLGGGAVATNIAVGSGAISSAATGGYNIAVGYNALTSLTSGQYNIGVGLQALQNAGAATNSVAIGSQALSGATPSSSGVAIGYQSAQYAQGSNIVAVGQGALAGVTGTNTGGSNSAFGYQAGTAITSGARNVLIGYQTGLTLAGGSQNVLVGYQAGQGITSGGNNVVIGGNSGASIATSNNNVIISDGAGNLVFSANSTQAVTIPGQTSITNATTASSTLTGALVITGDMGVRDIYARNIYANGSLVGSGGGGGGGSSTSTPYIVVTSGTVAISTGTGAFQSYGGGSLYGNLFVGQKLVVNKAYDDSGSFVQVGGSIESTANVSGASIYASGGNNYLYYSQDWSASNTNWTKGNSAAGLNATTSPDGTTDATLLTESGATGNHYFQQALTGYAGPITFSIYAKANTRTYIALYCNSGGSQHGVYFNLSTGAYQVGPSPAYQVTGKIDSVGYNGWYRCQMTVWASPAGQTTTVGVYSAQGYDTAISGSNTSFTGTGGAGAYIWGAQAEPSYTAGPYQLNTNAQTITSNNIYAGGSLYIANTATVNNAQVITTATLMSNLGLYGSSPNSLTIASGVQSTSTVTGSLIITNGGIGVGGNIYAGGSLYATTKSFLIDHPTKQGWKLQYGSLEGPENGVYVRGKLEGRIIQLPDYWTGLVDMDTITVDLTPIGKFQKLYVESIDTIHGQIFIDNSSMLGGPCKCFYTVWAERKDIGKLNTEFKG